jgi:hypothetical protein
MRVIERLVVAVEKPLKEAVWDCRMCGQCILHSTGLSCPMRCPKNLRNGPCGGVRANGNCEVYPDKRCVWVEAWEGSRRLPVFKDHIEHLQKPVDWQLQGTSSWINLVSGRDHVAPKGWEGHARS